MSLEGKGMVLSRSQFKQDFGQIKKEVKINTYNTYVQKHITYPAIDALSLHFTYLFLTSLECSREVRQMYCVSQSLIQLGLDCHDEVSTRPTNSEVQMKKKQLTVLSGDLFSGYYYFYLSQKNQLQLIKQWSKVIQEMNINKTDLHMKRNQLSAELDKERNELKKCLTSAVFSWFQASPFWYDTFSVASELRAISINHKDLAPLEALVSSYQNKLYQCKEEWLRDELKLWLDEIQQTHFSSSQQ